MILAAQALRLPVPMGFLIVTPSPFACCTLAAGYWTGVVIAAEQGLQEP